MFSLYFDFLLFQAYPVLVLSNRKAVNRNEMCGLIAPVPGRCYFVPVIAIILLLALYLKRTENL